MPTRLQVYKTLSDTGLVPLFYHSDPEVAFQITAACWRGGARAVEFTNRGDFAHEVFADLQKRVRRELPDLLLGAGSIPDAGTAALYMQMGAAFIITPLLREDVILVCNRRKVACLPGCTTAADIGRAEELGCEVVKLFPGDLLGPSFVKAMLGPQPWTCMMPTGGVEPTEASLRAWYEAGVFCVGMGSKLISSEVLSKKDYDGLEANVRLTVDTIQSIKKSLARPH